MSTIEITLSAANMGESSEADFDSWAAFVAANIADNIDTDSDFEISQFAFSGRGSEPEDLIEGATDEEHESIQDWLSHEGWDAFCGQDASQPSDASGS